MDGTTEREFTDFVARRTHVLLRIAYALTGDQQAAEDLVQNALAKAFVHWRGIRSEAEPYVRRIIYNDSVSRWRRPHSRAETTVASPPEQVLPPVDIDLRLVLRNALLGLPPRQRAVLVLRYLEDLSVDETAEILGCRRGTVASQASRALAKLRETIADLHQESITHDRHVPGGSS
jgi:RNA polymerase sigma-70 factor (sigma-E family)